MATDARNEKDLGEWEGTGWSRKLFSKNVQKIIESSRTYYCTRNPCGWVRGRVLREPMQLNCGHRLCNQCVEYLKSLPVEQQICDACADETYDDLEEVTQAQLNYLRIDFDDIRFDRAADKEIGRFEVVCPYECGVNNVRGTKLTVKHLEEHMRECIYRYGKEEEPAEILNGNIVPENLWKNRTREEEEKPTAPSFSQWDRMHPMFSQQERMHPMFSEQERMHPMFSEQERMHPMFSQRDRRHPMFSQRDRRHPSSSRRDKMDPFFDVLFSKRNMEREFIDRLRLLEGAHRFYKTGLWKEYNRFD